MNNWIRAGKTCCLAMAFVLLSRVTASAEGPPKWDIENPPGPTSEQKIVVQQGTWISVDVSPDGSTIIFDLLGDLYSMPVGGADGTNGVSPTKLTSGMAWDMQPRFSPDGQWICFTSDRVGKSDKAGDNIWIMRKDGTDLRQVTNETFRLLNNPSWSPDGNYLVARKHFTGRRSLGSGEIWMYHRAAAEANAMEGVQLTKRPTEQKDVNEPIFSKDGKYVFYSQDVTSGDSFEYDKDSNQQIYAVRRLNLQTGETDSYITGPGGACRPTPSPDGKEIAFVRRVGAKTGLHILEMESGRVRLVYDQLERDMQEAWAIHGVYPAFAWMPNGQEIVAWAKGQIRRIKVADGSATVIPFHIADTRKISQAVRFPIAVAPEQFPVKMLRWAQVSPTGKQMVFQALGHLYVRNLPDGVPQRLTQQHDHFEFYPSYSRDGKYIVYSTWNDQSLGSIRVVSSSIADQESWKVTSKPGHYSEPVFSPDSQSIVYVKESGGLLTSPLWSRDPGIYRVPVRGGDPVRITEQGGSPQFGSESGRVFYINGNGTKDADNLGLYSVDLEGRQVQHHLRSSWATDYRLSPDGKWVAFVERFNVYLVPLVHSGQTIDVGPRTTSIPTAKVSQEAGNGIHFSGDSQQIHWSLGPTLYSLPLQA
ncbi:MAG: PD40 domain-containing protein, partial [Planctomycetes bacterium]|nr:PD40 domain-containing protein [Planctomycetota bacterium]